VPPTHHLSHTAGISATIESSPVHPDYPSMQLHCSGLSNRQTESAQIWAELETTKHWYGGEGNVPRRTARGKSNLPVSSMGCASLVCKKRKARNGFRIRVWLNRQHQDMASITENGRGGQPPRAALELPAVTFAHTLHQQQSRLSTCYGIHMWFYSTAATITRPHDLLGHPPPQLTSAWFNLDNGIFFRGSFH